MSRALKSHQIAVAQMNRTIPRGTRFRHKDGGLYTFEEAGYMKSPTKIGTWFIGVSYRDAEEGALCTTHLGRWKSAFVQL